jgi:hypothetical protein
MVGYYQYFGGTFIFYPEIGSIMFLWDISNHLPNYVSQKPNKLTKAVTLLTYIREVSSLNLGRITNCPSRRLSWFLSSSSRQMPRYYLKPGHDRFLPYPFQFIVH